MRGVILLVLLPATAAAHDASPHLGVETAAGAEQCPAQEALEQRVQGILRQPLAPVLLATELTIDVRFERAREKAFIARVTATGAKPGQRLLRDTSPTCDALGEAVSVAIALLLDDALPPEHADFTATAANPATAAPASPKGADAAEPERRSDGSRWSARASLEAGGGYGLGASGGLLGFARFGGRRGRWLLDLGAGASSPREQGFGSGSVRTSLVFGNVRACYLLGRSLMVAPCVQAGLGRLRGEGNGYDDARVVSLPWTAVGLGLAAEKPFTAGFYATFAATLWVPTRSQTFSVESAGIAWESKPLAGALTAGVGISVF